MRAAVEIDPVQMARTRLLPAEHPEGERARPEAALRIGREIVEADGVLGHIVVEQHPARSSGEALEGQVSPADDQPVGLVQRHASDAPAVRELLRDAAVRVQPEHAAVRHVGVVEALPGRVPDRPLDQPVAGCELFHSVLRPAIRSAP